jgi:salicylate hydroxylase
MTDMIQASGPDKMTTLFDLAPEQRGKVVHRAALLAELHKPIDPSRKHTSKKVSRIDDSAAPLTIHFEDGSSFTADAVIGADGVRGHVRSHVLGSGE